MFSYSQETQKPLLQILCKCGRQFKREELYCCVSCPQIQCRYCTQVSMNSYYCRNCLHMTNLSDVSIRYQCNNCFECPLCRHTLSELKNPSNEKFYLYCQFCSWNSTTIGLVEEKSKDLASKCITRMKDKADPSQKQFQAIIAQFKEAQFQIEKEKKIRLNPKIGKKLLIPNMIGSLSSAQMKAWSMEKFKDSVSQQEQQLEKNTYKLEDPNLPTFKLMSEKGQRHQSLYEEEFLPLEEELAAFENLKNHELITNSEDCLKYPLLQPNHKSEMSPIPLLLRASKIRACQKCKKLVVKPESSQTHTTEFKIGFFLYEYSPTILIRKIAANKSSQEISVIIVMQNESEHYSMNVELENVSQETEKQHQATKVLILRRDKVSFKAVDLIASSSASPSATTQQEFEFILKPEDFFDEIKFVFEIKLEVEFESDKPYCFSLPVVVDLGKYSEFGKNE